MLSLPKANFWGSKAGLAIVFCASFLLLFLRRPDVLLNAQFWAEDGRFWYSQAYSSGFFNTLLTPENGYLQTISRLTAGFSLLFQLALAPLVFNMLALIIQCLPVLLLWSRRFSNVVSDAWARLLLTAIYLLLPNSTEIHANITNAHWHLALLAFMLLISAPAKSLLTKALEYTFFIVAGLSGPFSIFLAPIAIYQARLRTNTYKNVVAAILSACALAQMAFVITQSHSTRSTEILGTSVPNLGKILGNQIFAGSLLGEKILQPFSHHHFLAYAVALIGLGIILFAFLKGPIHLRLFILFTTLVFAASLLSPQVSLDTPQWQALAVPGTGSRYFFLPMLSWLAALVWLSGLRRPYGYLFAMILGVIIVGSINDFKYPRFINYHFRDQAVKFENMPVGHKEIFELNPTGWTMELTKQ